MINVIFVKALAIFWGRCYNIIYRLKPRIIAVKIESGKNHRRKAVT